MKIYLASSWRNLFQAHVLANLRAEGFEVYDFRNPAPGNTGFGWRQVIDRPIKTGDDLLEALAHPRSQEGFDLDFGAMKWADACVLLLPCGNSAHLEAGWFAGRGKPVAVLCPELREPELMYKCFDDQAKQTPLFTDFSKLVDHLKSLAPVDDESRCAVCAWPLQEKLSDGCVRGNCSQRPLPPNFYAPDRALREQRGLTPKERSR